MRRSHVILFLSVLSIVLQSCSTKLQGEDFTLSTRKNNPFSQMEPLLGTKGNLNRLIDSLKLDRNKIDVHIEKLSYVMYIVHDSLLLKKYDVVFGFNPKDDKFKQGDGCTPEGVYGIRAKYSHASWSKFIWIDYPNKQSWEKFKKAKMNGLIPKNATIGGEVGIHGVPKGYDYLIDEKENWTLGCISLKTDDINELYDAVSFRTKIYIFK